MKRTITAAAAAVALAGLAGCGAVEQATSAADEPDTTTAECEAPSRALVAKIGSVLNGSTKPAAASAVRSSEFEKAWFVAVQLKGPGMAKAGPAVFVVNALDGDGPMFAVGGMAHQFSAMGHGEDTDAAFSTSTAAFDAAVDCVTGVAS